MPTAESAATYDTDYCTVARADTIADELGLAWSGTPSDDEKTAALKRAQLYLDGMRWQGERTYGRSQANEWPRTGVRDRSCDYIPHDVIPREIEKACALLALVEQANPQALTPQVTMNELVKSERVGQLAVAYHDGLSVGGARPVVTIVRDALAPLRRGNPLMMDRA